MKLLIIEDEASIAQYLIDFFKTRGWTCQWIDRKEQLKELLKEDFDFDTILLDLNLNGENGEDFLKQIRKKNGYTPIVVTTAVGQLGRKIDLFNLGADDYMVKPYEVEELQIRIINLIKKISQLQKTTKKPKTYDLPKDFEFNPNLKTIQHKKNKTLKTQLTAKEAALLLELVMAKGEIVKNDDMIQSIWESKLGYQSNVISATLKRLKAKLSTLKLGGNIVTIKGVGIRLIF